ncbi:MULTISPECIES: sensor histidine kinase [unclassified Knoellia]|uniref:sensor histidine kinase n=1 Tax=Knoellia altitudinis TaxID=3404795 RepID=UPI0036148AAE
MVIGILVISRQVARAEALRDAEVTARAVAETIVAPLADEKFHANDPEAMAKMDDVLSHRVQDRSISHIKVWSDAGSGRGKVLWSDQKALVGKTFLLDAEEYAAFGTRDTVSAISDLDKTENQYEQSAGELVEVYTGVEDSSGAPLLFEVYISTDRLGEQVQSITRNILPLPIGAVLALGFVTIPLAASLARRVDRGQQQMQQLMLKAVESSDRERRRISQDLHDGVVQDLAGLGYALDSDARALSEDDGLRSHLEQLRTIVRRDLLALRSLMIDIYPPDLRTRSLAENVRELARQLNAAPDVVHFEIGSALTPHPLADRLTYRAVREALGNAVRHAHASTINVRLWQDETFMHFEVIDDGQGFDPAVRGPAGHFGIALMREMVAEAEGRLVVTSSQGHGTTVRGEIPL